MNHMIETLFLPVKASSGFSVVIPVHNNEKTIDSTVRSVLSNSNVSVEVILVENHSQDDSWGCCRSLERKYPGVVRAVKSFRVGVSAARNEGMARARGEFIGFCDADDVYEQGALDRVAELFMQGTYDMVVTGLVSVNESGKQVPMRVDKELECSACELQQRMLYQDCIMGSVWNKFFRRRLISGLSFDETLTHCEDMHFVSQVLKRACQAKVLISPCITYVYQSNSASVTRDCDQLLDESGQLRYVQALEKIMQMYPHNMRMWLLVRSCQFRLIEENIDKFEKNPQERSRLAKSAMRYVLAYLACRKRHPWRERLLRTLRVIKCLRSS